MFIFFNREARGIGDAGFHIFYEAAIATVTDWGGDEDAISSLMADVSSSSNQAGSWTPPHGGEEDDLVESEDEELVEDEEDEDETHEEEDKPRNTFDIRRTDVQNGADLQGIPWRQLSINRRTYRNTRTHDYPSFRNLDIPLKTLKPELTPTSSARCDMPNPPGIRDESRIYNDFRFTQFLLQIL